MNASNAKAWSQKQKEREKILRQMQKGDSGKNFFRRYYLAILLIVIALPLAALLIYSYQFYNSAAPLEVSGNTIFVRAGGDFQAALNKAKPGDTILLQAGATFRGSFILPNKAGSEFITIRTSASDAQLPPAGTRIDSTKYAAILPRLISPTVDPAINTASGAHHYRFIGIEFGATKGGFGNIIQIGTTEERRVEELPHHIEFDRVYLHGSATEGQRRGIAANGRNIKILNSHISGIKRRGEETQAIAVWASDGPIEIVNNYLEAAGIGILFGGATSRLNLIPSDSVVRDNHINKLLEWKGSEWAVKNLFEIKNGRRIKVQNNLMTNNWLHAQDGTAILFTTRTDSGENAVIEDIEFSGNVIRGSSNAVNVYGAEGKGGRNLTIRNNIFDDINGEKWGGSGFFLKATAWDGLIIENNTIIQSGNITSAYGEPVKNFIFRSNIVFQNEYGFFGDGMGPGKAALNKYFPGAVISSNIIIGGDSATYGSNNFYPVSINQIGFMNAANKDYRLRPESPFLKRGFEGKQIGADLNLSMVGGR